jgi:hypothetical protein
MALSELSNADFGAEDEKPSLPVLERKLQMGHGTRLQNVSIAVSKLQYFIPVTLELDSPSITVGSA